MDIDFILKEDGDGDDTAPILQKTIRNVKENTELFELEEPVKNLDVYVINGKQYATKAELLNASGRLLLNIFSDTFFDKIKSSLITVCKFLNGKCDYACTSYSLLETKNMQLLKHIRSHVQELDESILVKLPTKLPNVNVSPILNLTQPQKLHKYKRNHIEIDHSYYLQTKSIDHSPEIESDTEKLDNKRRKMFASESMANKILFSLLADDSSCSQISDGFYNTHYSGNMDIITTPSIGALVEVREGEHQFSAASIYNQKRNNSKAYKKSKEVSIKQFSPADLDREVKMIANFFDKYMSNLSSETTRNPLRDNKEDLKANITVHNVWNTIMFNCI